MSKTTTTPATDTAAAPQTILLAFQSLGMFASKDVRADTIELPTGDTAQFHVRELPDAEFRKLWADGDRAKLIAATICDEDGKPVLTAEQASQLKPMIAAKLQEVAMKHSGFGDKATNDQADAGND